MPAVQDAGRNSGETQRSFEEVLLEELATGQLSCPQQSLNQSVAHGYIFQGLVPHSHLQDQSGEEPHEAKLELPAPAAPAAAAAPAPAVSPPCQAQAPASRSSTPGNCSETAVGSASPPEPTNAADLVQFRHFAQQVQALRTRNRAAQQRRRARQRERQEDADRAVERLQQELQQLQAHQEELQQRNAALEAHRAAALQRQAAEALAEGPEGRPPPGAASCHDAWWLDGRLLADLQHDLGLCGEEMLLSVRPAAPLRLTFAEVAAMPPEEVQGLTREYLDAFAGCLLQMGGDATTPAGRRLAQLVLEAAQFRALAMASFPHRFVALHFAGSPPEEAAAAVQRQPGGGSEAPSAAGAPQPQPPRQPSADTWRKVAEGARLSSRQRDAIVALLARYLANMADLGQKRMVLGMALQEAVSLGPLPAPGSASGAHERAMAAAGALCANVRDEHSLLLRMTVALWRRVLTPAQAALLDIAAYPVGADLLAFSHAIVDGAAGGAAAGPGPLEEVIPNDMPLWAADPLDLGRVTV